MSWNRKCAREVLDFVPVQMDGATDLFVLLDTHQPWRHVKVTEWSCPATSHMATASKTVVRPILRHTVVVAPADLERRNSMIWKMVS